MSPKYVITSDPAYYPEVQYADDLQDALDIADKMFDDLQAALRKREDVHVCVAKIIRHDTICTEP